ncbi:VOC family protein [Streptococcus massiliensis]|uniref:Ring-cleavage extradiol dioxygenase n=1 Tax=Streptococcus massiliensis TaxID=313439 RepID=A0A380L0R7_9STRE|nr:VOC family protein [Streptococcus massiliensis]SUN77382.1 ring-cleavage extradiol dioxygenase [Streptococcus massiliensis]
MTYQYNSKLYLKEVALNVADLDKQKAFYQQILGLQVLEEKVGEVLLGSGDEPLVRILQTRDTSSSKERYGLYHLAILLPDRQGLADVFKHLAELKIPLVGGADHGYSEAIYLEDLEGNGIELYRDKPVTDWDIREDGRIIGVTEELAAQDIYELGKEVQPFTIAAGTRMGHVHLSVKNSGASSQFYQDLLAMADKFSVSSASWLASGDYHHHLAVNQWAGGHLDKREADELGLAYYTVQVASKEDLLDIYEKAQDLNVSSRWLTSSELEVTDPDGIVTKIRL